VIIERNGGDRYVLATNFLHDGDPIFSLCFWKRYTLYRLITRYLYAQALQCKRGKNNASIVLPSQLQLY
jgi:hypothetical protein